MTTLTKEERELLALTREHKKKEEELNDRLNDKKVRPINEETLIAQILSNHNSGNRIRELLDEIERHTFQDPSVLNHLKKIRNQDSETDKLYAQSIIYDLSTNCIRPVEDNQKRLDKINEGEHKQQDQTLGEMIDYFGQWAGGSITFSERKKEFGNILVQRSLPQNIEPYFRYIKNCASSIKSVG